MAVKILIDSASDINLNEAKALGIELISIVINFGEDEYFDGENLLPEQFYEKLSGGVCPQTSQINPFRFKEKFKKFTKLGYEVIVITLSSKLSGTYQSALQAAEDFKNVFVIDSTTACIGERLLCLYTIELVKKGLPAKEIADELETAKKKINVTAIVDTLEYLKRGGRISSSVAFVGSVLSIKPIIGVIDGEVKLIGKSVGGKRANHLLQSIVAEKQADLSKPYGIIWSGTDNCVLKKWIEDCDQLWGIRTENMPHYAIGSTIGTHIGPGAIGVSFFEK